MSFDPPFCSKPRPRYLALLLVGACSTALGQDIVINEINQNPSAVSDGNGEWLELFNPNPFDVDIGGWTLADNGIDAHVIGSSVLVPAGGYAVLGRNADAATNGGIGIDYAYGTGWFLSNGADEVILIDGNGVEIDRVEYDGGATFPDPNGASMALADPALDNSTGANWCEARSAIGNGDRGTPGAGNEGECDPVAVDIAQDALISELHYDNGGADVNERVEISAETGTTATGWDLVFYNGNGGAVYASVALSGIFGDFGDNSGRGALVVAQPGIQNGSPDGLALVDPDGFVVEFLSYEGSFTATDGAANGLTSTDIGVAESGSTPADFSLQRCPGANGDLWEAAQLNTFGAANTCADVAPALALISAIQGTGRESPLRGQRVVVEAVVIGDFQDSDADTARNLGGFFLQEEDSDQDADSSTSEGIFVFDPGQTADVVPGDRVRLTATVDEFFGETQLENVEDISIVGSGARVTPATIVLPTAAVTRTQDGGYEPDLEAYEGMLVRFADSLQIVEQFQLDRFNEIKLVQGRRPVQFTQVNAPSAALLDDYEREIGARRVTYDDGLNEQNANIGNLDGFGPVYTTASAPRMGDTVTGLTGVLDYKWAGNRASGATWRLRSVADGSVQFLGNAPRPDAPDPGPGLRIASLNVLNYFHTLDDGSTTALGFSPRGADSAAEFQRQTDKLVRALAALDADVVGLVELENEFDATPDGSTALEVLVATLNADLGGDVYRAVYPGQAFVGGDAIAVGLIYRHATVRIAPGSRPAVLDDGIAATLPGAPALPIFDGRDTNRAPLAVSFEHLASREVFTVAINHFKSKGGSGSEGNADAGDGAGAWNQRRLDAAVALEAWLASAPTGIDDEDRIILGDLNAYAQEDPIQYLLGNGYTNVEGTDDYSYVFDGKTGTLDYILISDAFTDRFDDAAVWNINADEADALDYNLDFGRDPAYFNGSSPARNSDHDPLVAVFGLVAATPGIVDIIELTLQGLDDGILGGTGPNSTVRVLNERSFVARLRQAEQREQRGIQRSVCQIMRRAALQTDADPRPGDRLDGSGLAALFDAISAYRSANCSR